MAMKAGWTGRVFEDFTIGDVYEHPLGRTILDADNVWFSCLTMNTNPIHFDGEYAAKTRFKKRLVNSCLTLSLVTGQSVIDLTMNAVANGGRLMKPMIIKSRAIPRSRSLAASRLRTSRNGSPRRSRTWSRASCQRSSCVTGWSSAPPSPGAPGAG